VRSKCSPRSHCQSKGGGVSLEYNALARRVRVADSVERLQRIERSCLRLYQIGYLTPLELGRLDDMIMRRIARMM